jgi:hypothetical protein
MWFLWLHINDYNVYAICDYTWLLIVSPNIPIVYAIITKMATIANAIYKCFRCCSHIYKIMGSIFNG